MPKLFIIMGPAGCGKSTIASAFAARARFKMIEADRHHPATNIEKQKSRIPLTDEDRAEWLDHLVADIRTTPNSDIVLACSALTPYVQNRLRDETEHSCIWLLIDVPREVLRQRLETRENHFMPVELLDNQIASLHTPGDVIKINGNQSVAAICDEIQTIR